MPSPDRSTDSISIAIVDDHPAIREVIGHRVEETMDMEVVACADSVGEIVGLIGEREPDVVVGDPFLLDGSPFELLGAMRAQCRDTQFLAFSVHEETVYAERVLRAGASGYLTKQGSMAELLAAVRQVAEGGTYLSPKMTTQVRRQMQSGEAEELQFPVDELTDRERQVFQMLGHGLTVEAVAERLSITQRTVETHRRRAKEKLGYESTGEVVLHSTRWVLGTNVRDARSESST